MAIDHGTYQGRYAPLSNYRGPRDHSHRDYVESAMCTLVEGGLLQVGADPVLAFLKESGPVAFPFALIGVRLPPGLHVVADPIPERRIAFEPARGRRG